MAGASKLALTSRRSLDGYVAKASFGAPTPIRVKASFGAPTPLRAKASFDDPYVTSFMSVLGLGLAFLSRVHRLAVIFSTIRPFFLTFFP